MVDRNGEKRKFMYQVQYILMTVEFWQEVNPNPEVQIGKIANNNRKDKIIVGM